MLKEYSRKKKAIKYYARHELLNPGDYYSTNCFDYHKCIFVHIPKAAGLSVCKSLFGNYAGGHRSIDWYVKNFGLRTVQHYFTFTIVRNPWSRLHSSFFYLKKGGLNEYDKEFYEKNLQRIDSFESFVMNWLNEEKLSAYWHFIPQHKFVTRAENPGKIMVDFVGRFEKLEEDFSYICNRLGMPGKVLVKINTIQNDPHAYVTAYNSLMKEKVADLYKKDITLFNYTFES